VTSRAALLALACAPCALAACFQQLDQGAASDPSGQSSGAEASAPGPDDAASAAGLTPWQICGSPSCDETNGTIPFMQQTPVIYLPDGGSTADPCTDVEALSISIRQTYCANCHGPGTGAGQGGFNYVLDDPSLQGNATTSATFPHFVVPGDPSHSYLYVSIATALMPPPSMAGSPPNPVPTASDLSVLYGWIVACFPDAGGYVSGGGLWGPGAPGTDGGGTASEAGATDAAGTTGDGGASSD
jgi:Planctomycete cytochrome C